MQNNVLQPNHLRNLYNFPQLSSERNNFLMTCFMAMAPRSSGHYEIVIVHITFCLNLDCYRWQADPWYWRPLGIQHFFAGISSHPCLCTHSPFPGLPLRLWTHTHTHPYSRPVGWLSTPGNFHLFFKPSFLYFAFCCAWHAFPLFSTLSFKVHLKYFLFPRHDFSLPGRIHYSRLSPPQTFYICSYSSTYRRYHRQFLALSSFLKN